MLLIGILFLQNMFLLVNKPQGITSHDVIYRLRKITNIKKIGHGGTLDPLATGLLIVGITRAATKHLGEITNNYHKKYLAEITLGENRTTDDAEGEIIQKFNVPNLKKDDILKVLKKFKGEIKQLPPAYSAIKINGKKAYDLARRGKSVDLKQRVVNIYNVKLKSFNNNIISIEFEVSSGTYIRSLARDIGKELKTGAYLSQLKRTQIGDFKLKNAVDLNDLTKENWQSFTFSDLIHEHE